MAGPVFINQIYSFLPGSPIGNEEMEDYLGFVGGKKSRSKAIVLRNNKIVSRYYARDKQGNDTYTNAELTANAINGLCARGFDLAAIELLTSGTTSPDQLLPAHGVMVHGLLQTKPMEVISFSGSCCSSINALKYAYFSIKTGNTKNAVTTGSEKLSTLLTAQNFEDESAKLEELDLNPALAFEKEFLRWMLSDGAAAAWLSDTKNESGITLRIEWIEICSFANELETCMYMGAGMGTNGKTKGWLAYKPKEWLEHSIFALKQNVVLLNENIARLGTKKYVELFEKHKVDPKSIDWFVPHISSEYFRSKVDEEMKKYGVDLPQEKWYTNLSKVGNVGSASILLALDELMKSGKLIVGQKIILTVPESARFSYANVLLTVV